jgi:transcription initiation factor TFIIE subunit alpha
VPENDFQTALSLQKPVTRADTHPGARTEVVDLPNRNLQSTKGLEIKPEKISIQLQDDEDVKRENAAAEAAARREREARQNALPEWISKSTVSGDITAVGAKEEKQRREREAHSGVFKEEANEDVKPNAGEEDIMANYWAELARAKEEEAAKEREEDDDEDDEDEDDFEDVGGVVGTGSIAAMNGRPNGAAALSTGVNTPNIESSNATDDERPSKRARSTEPTISATSAGNDNAEASDEDEDDVQFEDV